MAPPDPKGGGGLSLQTLAVASAASVTAAMVTARLFPPGTIYASALMPVLVAAVSELLHRPANRVSALREQRRTLVRESRQVQRARVLGDEPSPLRGAPDWARGEDAPEPGFASTTNGNGDAADPLAGVQIHGRTRRPRPPRIHPRAVVATGLAAFAIGAAAITLPELIFGGSLATTHDTTYFGGGKRQAATTPKPTQQQKTQTNTVTQTTTTQAPAQSAPTTATQTGSTPTSASPGGGAAAPPVSSDAAPAPTTTAP
jgi:hypothetical protein